MTTQQIAYFLTLSDELHYWNTSFKMNITQSALSRQIKALEEELKVELFKRSSRKVELTAAGLFLQQHLKPLLAQMDATIQYAQKISQGEGGTIVINHPGSISYEILPDLLSRLAERYPDVKVELIQLKNEQEVEFLRSFRSDISFSRSQYDFDDLSSKLINTDYFSFVLPKDHIIRTEAELTPDVLKQQRYIIPKLKPGDSYPELLKNLLNNYGITPDIYLESDFGSTILSLVESGLGISILPYSFSHTRHPGIRFIRVPFTIPLYVYWRKDEDNAVVKNVLNLIA